MQNRLFLLVSGNSERIFGWWLASVWKPSSEFQTLIWFQISFQLNYSFYIKISRKMRLHFIVERKECIFWCAQIIFDQTNTLKLPASLISGAFVVKCVQNGIFSGNKLFDYFEAWQHWDFANVFDVAPGKSTIQITKALDLGR